MRTVSFDFDACLYPQKPPLHLPDRPLTPEEWQSVSYWNVPQEWEFSSEYDPDHPFFVQDRDRYLGWPEACEDLLPLGV